MRYIAQTRVPEIGKSGQERLRNATVLIVGCGALGGQVAMYLAGAGVGHITIADFDTIEISNLHRQTYYSEKEAGEGKAHTLKKRMGALNSEIEVCALEKLVTRKVMESLSMDLVIDAADNPETTYLLSQHCKTRGIPFITAGISGWKAQVFVYIPGSLSFSDIFPAPEENAAIMPCSMAGITGPTAGYASALQSSEAIKILTGNGPKESKLYVADLLQGSFTAIC